MKKQKGKLFEDDALRMMRYNSHLFRDRCWVLPDICEAIRRAMVRAYKQGLRNRHESFVDQIRKHPPLPGRD